MDRGLKLPRRLRVVSAAARKGHRPVAKFGRKPAEEENMPARRAEARVNARGYLPFSFHILHAALGLGPIERESNQTVEQRGIWNSRIFPHLRIHADGCKPGDRINFIDVKPA